MSNFESPPHTHRLKYLRPPMMLNCFSTTTIVMLKYLLSLPLFQYNYNRERAEPGQQRRTPTELELNSELEAARPQTAGK